MSRPRVLVTLDTGTTHRRGVPFASVEQKAAYGAWVARAGGLPLWVGPESADAVDALVDIGDAVVVTGGDFDISPALYGATSRGARLDPEKPARTRFESQLVATALEKNLPILGICGGMQLLAVVMGGTLVQDIASEIPGALEHEQPGSPAEPAHPVRLEAGCFLANRLRTLEILVNSTHHQAVASPGPRLSVIGRAPDGVVEAVADDSERRVGVQWHPELLDDAACQALYEHLVFAARRPV